MKDYPVREDYQVTCVNCGKQNIIFEDDPYDVKCEYGEHPVRIVRQSSLQVKKEVNNMTGKEEEITIFTPPAPKNENYSLPVHSDSSPNLAKGDAASERVPPRPDMSGKPLGERLKASHAYYEANKQAILHDLGTLGEKAMLKRWKISQGTWGTQKVRCGLRNRWRPEVYGEYISSSKARRTKADAPQIPIKKEKASRIIKMTPAVTERTSDKTGQPEDTPEKKPESATGAGDVDKVGFKIILVPSGALKMPPLPAFKWYWWPGIQEKWLETYARLVGK